MADIHSANSRLQSAKLETINEAAEQLSVAAAIAAARIDGEKGQLCGELNDVAANFKFSDRVRYRVKDKTSGRNRF